ncbi:hypothetical protein BDN70DRAFT_692981 [Pholiota conissans]|uniref:DUF6533 domain-containing protein n=1 Tax=Pholiota conissans TaxID=109636 RepID=A0A9P5Z1F3_9AGAR|nr:hypothetical protein BDN70DRAFT_692981 [Pholiota conissans]
MVNGALVALFESLAAGEIAKTLTISMLALTSYDYVLTLEKEVLYFWQGPFTISHALFFFNRYASICLVLFDTISIKSPYVAFTFADSLKQFLLSHIQATNSKLRYIHQLINDFKRGRYRSILITRVWFLFPGEKHVQFGLIFFFVVSLITSAIFLSLSLHSLEVVNLSAFLLHFRNAFDIAGCHADRPVAFWRVYLPSLILHTGLYIMTAYHAITNWDDWHQVNLRRRLLRDGGVFYLIVFVTVGFASAGSFFSQIPQINIPAIFSPDKSYYVQPPRNYFKGGV